MHSLPRLTSPRRLPRAAVLALGLLLAGCGGQVDGIEDAAGGLRRSSPPSTPTNVTATVIGCTEIDVAWTASNKATSYTVARDGAVVATVTSTQFADTGVQGAQTHSYTVVASNGSGSSAPSGPVQATTPSCAPGSTDAGATQDAGVLVDAGQGGVTDAGSSAPQDGGSAQITTTLLPTVDVDKSTVVADGTSADSTNFFNDVDDGTSFLQADDSASTVRNHWADSADAYVVGFTGAPSMGVTSVEVSFRATMQSGITGGNLQIQLYDGATLIGTAPQTALQTSWGNYTVSFSGLSVPSAANLRVRVTFNRPGTSGYLYLTQLWLAVNGASSGSTTDAGVPTLDAGSAAPDAGTSTDAGSTFTSAPQYPPVTVQMFPADNVWNTKIANLPVHPKSATWMATVGTGKNVHVGFYPDQWGMRYNLVDAGTPKTMVTIVNQDPADSDLIPYPFTADTLLQLGTPDSEAFMIDQDQHYLYEMYNAHWNNGAPYASATVRWDLTSNALRADNRSSADEAGLPIFSGLFRWDEVQRGQINHALRFENGWGHIDGTAGSHLWPARHDGFESPPNASAPPMGARLRLKASFDASKFSKDAQVVLTALKDYGMFLADHGEDWELVGTGDSNWPLALLNELGSVPASAFEFVDESSLMIDPNSAQAQQLP